MFGRSRRNKGKSGSTSQGRCRNLFYLNGAMITRRRVGDCRSPCSDPPQTADALESMNNPILSVPPEHIPEANIDHPTSKVSTYGDEVPIKDAVAIMCDYFEKYEGSRDILYRFSGNKVGIHALSTLRKWASLKGDLSSDSETSAELIPPPSPERQDHSEGGRDDDDIPDEFGIEEPQEETPDEYMEDDKEVPVVDEESEVVDEESEVGESHDIVEPENWTIAMKSDHNMVKGVTNVEGYVLSIDLEIEDIPTMPIEIYPFGSGEDKSYMYPFDEDIVFSFKYADMTGNATCSLDEEDRFLSIDMLMIDNEELSPPLDGKTVFTLTYPPEDS